MRVKLFKTLLSIGIVIVLLTNIIIAKYNEKNFLENTIKDNDYIVHSIAINLDKYLNEITKTTKTLASISIIKESLLQSNRQFNSLDEEEIKNRIEELNDKWININNINDPFIQNYISNPVAKYLKHQQEIIPNWYGEIFLTNKYGELVASTSKLTTLAHGHKYWWLASYNEGIGRIFFDDRGFDSSVEGYVLGVVTPVYDNNEIIGILKCNINILSLFSEMIKDYSKLYEQGTIKIARTGGSIIYEPGEVPLSTELDKAILSNLDEDSPSKIITDDNNNEILFSYNSINSTEGSSKIGFGGSYESIDHIQGNTGENWIVTITVPKEIINKQVLHMIKQFFVIGLIMICFFIVLTAIFIRQITKPILELAKISEEVSKGNLNKQIKIKSKDEIGKLANSFNEMIVSINNTMASKDELTKEIEKRKKIEAELKYLSTIDELTSIYNRRAFNDYLEKFISISKRYHEPLSIAMVDIDYFKKINDNYGHNIGDEILIKFSEILKKSIRELDILARWGGEEFIILLPKTEIEDAYNLSERLRKITAETNFKNNIHISISIGVTQFRETDTLDQLIKRADEAQYKAKFNGRNNVQVL